MIQAIDEWVFNFFQTHQNSLVNYTFRDITSLGGDTLVALITVFVTGALLWTGSTRSALLFALTMIATAGIIVGLKLLIGRPCPLQPDPYQVHYRLDEFPMPPGLSIHLPCMPSGHTCGSLVLYSLIMFAIRDTQICNLRFWKEWRRWVTGWLIALPIVIGFSRLYLSAHWFTDVIAGYGLGWIIVGVQRWMFSSAAR